MELEADCGHPECKPCNLKARRNVAALQSRLEVLESERGNLAMMIRVLARKLRTVGKPSHTHLSETAISMLRNYDLEGSPLRGAPEAKRT